MSKTLKVALIKLSAKAKNNGYWLPSAVLHNFFYYHYEMGTRGKYVLRWFCWTEGLFENIRRTLEGQEIRRNIDGEWHTTRVPGLTQTGNIAVRGRHLNSQATRSPQKNQNLLFGMYLGWFCYSFRDTLAVCSKAFYFLFGYKVPVRLPRMTTIW